MKINRNEYALHAATLACAETSQALAIAIAAEAVAKHNRDWRAARHAKARKPGGRTLRALAALFGGVL